MDDDLFALPSWDEITAALRWPSTRMLIIANLAALAGVFAGWSVPFLLVVYWVESVVIGAYTILKMFVAASDGAERVMCIGLTLVFILHFGVTMLVVAVFLSLLIAFIQGTGPDGPTIEQLQGAIPPLLSDPGLPIAIVVMVISHGVAFVTISLRGGALEQRSPSEVMMDPYRRVVVMLATFCIGLALSGLGGLSVIVAAALVLLKTAADVAAHAGEYHPEPDQDASTR